MNGGFSGKSKGLRKSPLQLYYHIAKDYYLFTTLRDLLLPSLLVTVAK